MIAMPARAGLSKMVAWALVISIVMPFFWLPLGATAEGTAQTDAMAVTVQRAKNRCFADRLAASGVFVAGHEVDLRPDRDGLVVSDVLAEPGDMVAKGKVLARLVSPKTPNEAVALAAPVPGLIMTADAVIGAYTSASASNPLFRVAENGELVLKAETLATNLPRLREGMSARIHVLGVGDVDGRVASIADGVEAQTQLGTLRLSVTRDPRLRIGDFARAEIDAGQNCGLTLPLSAVLFAEDGPVVATVQSDRVVMRRVTTSLMEGGDIEIRDGLAVDDLVVIRAAPFLRDGDNVRAILVKP